MSFKRFYKYLIAFKKVFLKYFLISYYFCFEILKLSCCVVRIKLLFKLLLRWVITLNTQLNKTK